MDAHISKKRIGHMLSYDWIKIIAIAAAAIIVWSLLFTMLATRATIGQTFYFYYFNDMELKNNEKLNTLDYLKEKNALSYDVLEFTQGSFSDDSQTSQAMAAWFSAKQGDILWVSDVKPEPEKEGEETFSRLQQFATSYYSILAPLGEDYVDDDGKIVKEDYLKTCEKYLAQFYTDGDFREGNLEAGAVENSFRTRMKKDKRYKTEAQIAEGIKDETARIENLRDSYLNVQKALEVGVLSIKETKIWQDKNNDNNVDDDEWKTVRCAFDLSNLTNITEYITNGDKDKSNEGICLSVFDWAASQYDLQFEPITYLNFILTTYDKSGKLSA